MMAAFAPQRAEAPMKTTTPLRGCAHLLAATLLALATGAAASTDATFAQSGIRKLPWTQAVPGNEAVAIAPDGGSFVAQSHGDAIAIVRLDAHGHHVPTYRGGGITRVSLPGPLELGSIHVEADGGLILGLKRELLRVTPEGVLDETFGDKGRLRIPYLRDPLCEMARIRQVLAAPGGARIAVGSHADSWTGTDRACSYVARVTAEGQVDATFGDLGNIRRAGFEVFDARILPGGGTEIIGRRAGTNGQWIERIGAGGEMELPFGNFGSFELTDAGPRLRSVDGRILGDGSLVFVSASSQQTLVIHRYRPDHAPDPVFAGINRAVISVREGVSQSPRILPLPDGGFLVRADGDILGTLVSGFYKIDAVGIPEPNFGDRGYLRHLAAGHSRVSSWAAQPDGFVVFAGAAFRSLPPPPPPVIPPPPFVAPNANAYALRLAAVPNLVEFRNADLDHYFLTYDGAEARGIDLGAAGPGWSRTGHFFKPGGPSPVCRFYNPGANTHFFTIEPGECDLVRQSPGWTYEGLGFGAHRLLPSGACAAGFTPVQRLYNDRAAANDSNHRYTTSLAVVAQMQARGWILEGPVFCVRP